MTKSIPIQKRNRTTGDANAVKLATATLFDDGGNSFSLRDGTKVEVKPGTVRSLGVLLMFFDKLLERMNPEQLAKLLQLIAEQQTVAMAKGVNPLTVNPADPGEALAQVSGDEEVAALIRKALDNGSLVLTLLHAVYDVLPSIVSEFSNLDSDRFMDLTLDEGAKVAVAVVALNYDFFFQSMQPGFMAFLQAAVRKAKS